MSLQKESYDSFKSKRIPFNLTFQKSPFSKRVFLFYPQISMLWTLFKEGIFFISKSQCRELLPKRILSLLKLSMVMHSWRIHQISKNLHVLLKTSKIFNFDFLSITMCMPCKVTWNATLKCNYSFLKIYLNEKN